MCYSPIESRELDEWDDEFDAAVVENFVSKYFDTIMLLLGGNVTITYGE